jgi:hypothetical protein
MGMSKTPTIIRASATIFGPMAERIIRQALKEHRTVNNMIAVVLERGFSAIDHMKAGREDREGDR